MAQKPGGHVTPHQGGEIDRAIERGNSLRVVNNGFMKLDSAELNPVNLNKLKSSGNYSMSFYEYGPVVAGVRRISPLNLTVVLISGELYQFAKLGVYNFSRKYDTSIEAYGPWYVDQTAGAINPGPVPPSSPVNGKTLWLDASTPAAPTLKFYVNNTWVELLPATAMLASVYDPEGKKTDIYKYIDDSIGDITDEDFSKQDIIDHIEDEEIHVDPEERLKWNGMATYQDLDDSMAALHGSTLSNINTAVSGDLAKIDALVTGLVTIKTQIESHVNNENIHPTPEKMAEWDNKVDGDHTHILDDKVVIDTTHIEGTIPASLIPYVVSERVHQVSSIEEMLQLEAPAHNGDVVCVSTNGFAVMEYEFGIGDADDAVLVLDEEDVPIALQRLEPSISTIWYFIIDDTKLSSLEGYLRFSTGNTSFDTLQNKPTTLRGYGITDATPKSDFNAYVAKLAEAQGIDTTNLQELQRKYNRLMANRVVLDLVKTDGGVESDTGNDSTLRFELAVQNTKTLNVAELVIPAAMQLYPIAWSSDNTAIAQVSSDGIVTGIAEGTCLVTGYCEDFGFIVEAVITVGASVYSLWTVDPVTKAVLVDNDQVALAFDERSV